jgi:hypothetical protein
MSGSKVGFEDRGTSRTFVGAMDGGNERTCPQKLD